MKQLEKVLKDYFDLSDRVKEMHSEIFSLKGKLSEAVTLQCVNKECIQRNNGSESASSFFEMPAGQYSFLNSLHPQKWYSH